jgi:hypothetical protein
MGAIAEALRIPEEAPELRASAALVGRLRSTPHGYFRFVNRRFSESVCRLFGDVRAGLPDVNLHGDAHVEQYAVTNLGRGLTDFDESARGPNVIDLVRFGVSLELAARERGWTDESHRAFDEFLRGYREALEEPSVDRPPSRVVGRARAAFAFDHDLALGRAPGRFPGLHHADARGRGGTVHWLLPDQEGGPSQDRNRERPRREVPAPDRRLDRKRG